MHEIGPMGCEEKLEATSKGPISFWICERDALIFYFFFWENTIDFGISKFSFKNSEIFDHFKKFHINCDQISLFIVNDKILIKIVIF